MCSPSAEGRRSVMLAWGPERGTVRMNLALVSEEMWYCKREHGKRRWNCVTMLWSVLSKIIWGCLESVVEWNNGRKWPKNIMSEAMWREHSKRNDTRSNCITTLRGIFAAKCINTYVIHTIFYTVKCSGIYLLRGLEMGIQRPSSQRHHGTHCNTTNFHSSMHTRAVCNSNHSTSHQTPHDYTMLLWH